MLHKRCLGTCEEFCGLGRGGRGSSFVRNPVTCEQICGLARLVRSNMLAAFEDVALWHERDISHSSVERIVLPDACLALDYMLQTFAYVMRDLEVYEERMLANLNASGGLVFSGRALLALVESGMRRNDAYEIIQ